jgi:hypothetical protein
VGFLFIDAGRNSALAFVIFGALLFAMSGVAFRAGTLAMLGRVLLGAGLLSAAIGCVLAIVHRF